MANLIKKIFGGGQSEDLLIVSEVVLGRKEEPSKLASAAGITWNPKLQEEWDRNYTRCSGCRVWIKGRRSLWCEVCKNKGF